MESTSTENKALKVLLGQLNPVFKRKQENLSRVAKSMERYGEQDGLDLVMFPEMAFVGYNFKNREHIIDETEELGKGASFEFCIGLAKRLKSYVIFGYAEKKEAEGKTLLFNSACLLDRSGNIVVNAHKSHLYESDALWSEEGEGFKTAIITTLAGDELRCAIGICMDINPYKWHSGKNELADFVNSNNCEVLLFLSAWNDHEPNHPNESRSQIALIEYWLHRLRPLLSDKQNKCPEKLFIVCDRVGTETTYTNNKE